MCKPITNEYASAKLCKKSAFRVCYLTFKNCRNRITTFEAFSYRNVDPVPMSDFADQNIGQSMRYINKLQNKYLPKNIVRLCLKWVKYDQY